MTPVILKDERGYWKDCMSEEEFKNRININLAKKVNQLFAPVTNECLEPKAFYSTIEFLNQTPVPMQYKNVRLLGDKIRLSILDDKLSRLGIFCFRGRNRRNEFSWSRFFKLSLALKYLQNKIF